jgi:hypothetical protein
MERALRRRTEERRTDAELPPLHAEAPGTGEDSPQSQAVQAVVVHWGAYVEAMAVGGMTVADVRRLLLRPHNIPPQARTFVNGDEVDGTRRLAPGDTLEFSREAGEKGACHARR